MFGGLKKLWDRMTGKSPAQRGARNGARNYPSDTNGITLTPASPTPPPVPPLARKPVEQSGRGTSATVVPIRKPDTSNASSRSSMNSDGSILGMGPVADAVIISNLISSDPAPASSPAVNCSPTYGGGGGDYNSNLGGCDISPSPSTFDMSCDFARERPLSRTMRRAQGLDR